jgi:IrrE N-terminal-like domain
MEVEANQFAALLLMPPPALRKFIQRKGNPDLQHVIDLAKHFNVSKEAAARAYAQYHGETIAIVITHNDLVIRAHRSLKFPRISASFGKRVPAGSVRVLVGARRRSERRNGTWFSPGHAAQEELKARRRQGNRIWNSLAALGRILQF